MSRFNNPRTGDGLPQKGEQQLVDAAGSVRLYPVDCLGDPAPACQWRTRSSSFLGAGSARDRVSAFFTRVYSDRSVPPGGSTYSTCSGVTRSNTRSGSLGPSGNQPRQAGVHRLRIMRSSFTSSADPETDTYFEFFRNATQQRGFVRRSSHLCDSTEVANHSVPSVSWHCSCIGREWKCPSPPTVVKKPICIPSRSARISCSDPVMPGTVVTRSPSGDVGVLRGRAADQIGATAAGVREPVVGSGRRHRQEAPVNGGGLP